MDRRSLMMGAGALALAGCVSSTKAKEAETTLRAIETRLGGRLGVEILDTGSGARIAYRADERFAMASTFKLALAAAVLHRIDRGELSRTQIVPFGAADLLSYAPVAQARLAEGGLSIETLCAAIVEVSDNTAANLLLNLVGGPAGFTAFLRAHGDTVTRLDRTEPELNSNIAGDPRDTTTPSAMLKTMQTFVLGDALSSAPRESLTTWMINARTGLNRLRPGLPADWRAGDKTGNGGNGATNDIAIAWPPGRRPILLSVYASDTIAEMREVAFKEIGALAATL